MSAPEDDDQINAAIEKLVRLHRERPELFEIDMEKAAPLLRKALEQSRRLDEFLYGGGPK